MLQQPVLAAIRAALCDRIDAEAIRQQRLATSDVSMPSSLLAAGLWLTERGWIDQASPGEVFFAWGPPAYRRYLDRLTPDQRTTEIEAGHRVIFEGRGNRPPLLARFTEQTDGFFQDAA
ncbi:MAG TPA: hypothetical protein VK533_07715 [Sphingomonas sp.]|uniref:hypothetical protein n=1 Tax=Sphingomonas sp. TaxID=28214 RepID=UPI002B90FC99|nr:hypothetical protein [Sphingomonas sp.]HMI19414.1 hypothetical protein [Sphingomonas sp.]